MPTFQPGESRAARADIVINPSGLASKAELYLVDGISIVATSGIIPFVSTGDHQPIIFPVTMPMTEGEYPVWVDVLVENLLVFAGIGTEEVKIIMGEFVEDIIGSQVSSAALETVIEPGGDYDIVSKSIAFSPDSIAVVVGWAVCSSKREWLELKLRLYVDNIQIAESGYLPWVWTLDQRPMIILIGLKAVSGTSVCKLGCHNYAAPDYYPDFERAIYISRSIVQGHYTTPPLAGIAIGSAKFM